MKDAPFSLQPFAGFASLPQLTLTGSLRRRQTSLIVNFRLYGEISRIEIPAPARHPARRDRLWQETCFEFFLAPADASHYWECNLSPAGHWNLYRFSDYRQGMRQEMRLGTLPFTIARSPDTLTLDLRLDLEGIIPADTPLLTSVCTVLNHGTAGLSYWALSHQGLQPDFHRRASFLIQLSAQAGAR